ncbi:MAG: hypothetical protein HUJ95_07385 [Bacteroidales bacterium]|nr:hypothetical protein [Bacteroidales bacterium]
MKKMNKTVLVSFLLALPFASSCNYDDAKMARPEELGAKVKEYVVDEQPGTIDIDYLSNLSGTITFTEKVDWAALSSNKFNGDGKVTVVYDANEGFPRMAQIELISSGNERRDTIQLQQKGVIMPILNLPATNALAYNKQDTKVAIETNVPSIDEFDIKIKYVGSDEEWIEDITMSNGFLNIKTKDNTTADIRNAVITFKYVDGWKKVHTVTLSLTQANNKNEFGVERSFPEIREIVEEAGGVATITGDYLLNGYVVSDKSSLNSGENPRTTTASIDYTMSQRTVYFESLDGKYGFMLEFADEENNTLERYTKVQILIKGAKVTQYIDPKRFVISGLLASQVMKAEKVSESEIPAKQLHYKDITDDDIYTQVQLMDIELPVRQGPLFPCNEGYTLATGADRITKYPKLLMDNEGNMFYLLTNSNCVYRNNGQKLPYGKGSMKLVVVHEKCRQYVDEDNEDEDECGYIGRYQFRHVALNDLYDNMTDGILDDVCGNGFLTEYRYMKSNGDGTWAPTYGKNGWFTHSYKGYKTSRGDYGHGTQTFKYLGPIGNLATRPFGLHRGNENGLGIFLEDGTEYGNAAMGGYFELINDDANGTNYGKGWVPADCYCAWANAYWWDDEREQPYYWLINFSTKDIETDYLTLQMTVMNNAYEGGPRYWKAEWTTDPSDDDWDSSAWKLIDNYVVSDVANWNNTLYYQFSAFKEVGLTLPLEMLDKESVYIRLMPSADIAGDQVTYQGGTIAKSGKTANSAIDYFAIRYSKK